MNETPYPLPLAEARRLVGISQMALDSIADVSKGTTFDIETGRTKRPGFDTVVKLARALQKAGLTGLRPEQLLPLDASAPVSPEPQAA